MPAAVMDLLDRCGPMTTSDLAALRQVRQQTTAATVKDIVAAGYVVLASRHSGARARSFHEIRAP